MYAVKITNLLMKKNYLLYFFILAIFFLFYFLAVNKIKSYNSSKEDNFNSFLGSSEFDNIRRYIFENLNSPYKEYNYIVKNNDTIEKILKKYKVNTDDVNNIAKAVVKKKISNIFSKTNIKIIIKEEAGANKIVSLFYPINEITTIEIKRNKDEFVIN